MEKFLEIDEDYGILKYINLCYEPSNLVGRGGIAGEKEEYIKVRGDEINMYRLGSKTIKVTDRETLITTASKGDQSKWKVGNLWIKADTQGFEGLAEEFSSLFLSCIENIDHVPYYTCTIEKENGGRARGCYSESMFRNIDEVYITFHKLYEQMGLLFEEILEKQSTKERILGTVEYIQSNYGVDITEYLIKTLYIDAMIINEDRHPSNLGLIKDIETNEYRIAPIFDNGLAFLARDTHWGKMPLHVAKRNIKFEPFGNKQMGTLMEMTNYKLLIDKDLLDKKVKGYENPLYSKSTTEQTKKILLDNLTMWEGKLWIRK